MREVEVTNMTSLFSKDMLIYSFFDLRLKSPLRVVAVLYFIVLFLIIGVPVLMFSWPPNVYTMFIAIGIPGVGSYFMSKPIWEGKSFFSYAKTQVKYFIRPKALYDWKVRNRQHKYVVENQILVSRHDDYNELYNMVKEEAQLNE